MKEIITKCELTDAGFTIIAEKYQRVSQYGNMGAQLLHKNKCVVYVEDNGADKTTYLLDKEEREAALKNPDLYLDTLIHEWEDTSILDMFKWFPETIDHNFEEGQPCKVLVVGCYYGFEPIEWATYDFPPFNEIIFGSPALAQDWINEQESGTYILKNGEAGRPEYFIIA